MAQHTINGVPAELFVRVRENGVVQVANGVEYVWEECTNCGGTGHFPSLVDSARCFYCRNERGIPQGGRWVTKADRDRRAHNRQLAAARRERKAAQLAAELPQLIEGFVAAHPLLAELTYLADYSGLLGSLRGQLEKKGTLSARQIEVAEKIIRQDYERQAQVDATVTAKREESAKRVDAHFGEQGERLTITGTVRFTKGFEGQWGMRTLFAIDTPRGTVTWWATGVYDQMRGETVTLTGTVKDHETYQGERRTVLTRGKLHS